MTKTITALVLAIVTLTGASAAFAKDGKPSKPKSCTEFTEASLADGSKLGVCAPSKPGGKPTYLRTYSITSIKDGDGVVTKVMIGYR